MIELKTGHDDAKLVQEVARVVGEATTSSGVCWGSFDADILGALHAAQPKIPLVGIVYTPEMIAAQGALPIALWASSDALAQSASIRGHLLETAPLWCWTVNTPSAAEALLAQGVQGLITDCPSHIRDSLPEDDGNI
jgi:glycerophosphoryl diester phosphodiesterase